MRETVAIAASDLRAEIVPWLGAGLARFDVISEGVPIAVFRPWPEEGTDDPNRLAPYPLVPWSNRIADGGFYFGGQFCYLEANFPDNPFPQHGNGWLSSREVRERLPDRISLDFDSSGPGPFRYAATAAYALTPAGLTMRLSVISRAEMPLPYGLGFHPWLPRTAATRLQARANAVWLEDARHLPTGEILVTQRSDWNFSAPRALPEDWISNAFTCWDSRARIEWPDRGLVLRVEASEALTTYLLYSPSARSHFFCFEPVSHPVNAHNLLPFSPIPVAHGLRILAPGEAFAVFWHFTIEVAVCDGAAVSRRALPSGS